MAGRIRVGLCDDNDMVRDALATFVSADPTLVLVASWSSGEQMLAELQPDGVDVVLLDVRMPGMDGPAAAQRVQQRARRVKLVYLSSYPDEIPISDALDGTVVGALTKEITPQDLSHAIHLAASGNSLISQQIRHRTADLSRRHEQRFDLAEDELERDVLKLLCKGFTNDEIASQLHRSSSSVKQILGKLTRRAGVRNRTELVLSVGDAQFESDPDLLGH